MRPVTFINGVIFGSTAALSGVLGVLLFFRFVLSLDDGLDQSVVRNGLPAGKLLLDMLVFSVLALLAGIAFWGQLARRRWRWGAEYILVVALVAVVLSFLAPDEIRSRDLVVLAVVSIVGILFWLGAYIRG